MNTQFKASASPIVHGFQAFYYELLKQKEICLSQFFTEESVDPADVIDSDDSVSIPSKGSLEVEATIVKVQKKLISSIDKIFEVISSRSRLGSKKIDEVKYIITVLADEIFINMKWEGAKFWRFSLLEKQIFQSEVAGEKFFAMLDEFLSNMNNIQEEMAFLYLMAISLGFKGKYRGQEDMPEYISWYKDRLYSILHNKPSRLFYPGRQNMINQCYEHTFMDHDKKEIPDTRFWSICIMAIVTAYIAVSFAVWFGITNEINDVLKHIAEQIRSGPLI
ncbi:MAG: DotU family type IV/VI secretion system protein [Holosporales bacterium]|jgi:type VI secretion system protein ImpK|nr:DotU family type IV/VI secretion system protein [Holosporales bacterium]